MSDRSYLIAISQVAHVGPVRLQRLRDHFNDLEMAWRADRSDLAQVLDERTTGALLLARDRVDPLALLGEIERDGISVVTIADAEYPRLLSHISAAPPVLYVRGSLDEADDTAVAIVGTRRATAYGREVTQRIASELAGAGVTIVSGLARGIDGIAHRGALDGGGRTIAVLASGVDIMYPPEHRELADRILDSGALVSDYPPGTKPDAPNFPARNRIISGLSAATLVVEAPRRSGALITVSFAADQSRDVFVVPGSVLSAASEGVNRLLRDGARAVTSAADILEDLGLLTQVVPIPEQTTLPLTDAERRLMALVTGEPQHIDELSVAANLSISEASALITMLELKGLVRNAGSQHFVAMGKPVRQ